jgi:hypothetical protein
MSIISKDVTKHVTKMEETAVTMKLTFHEKTVRGLRALLSAQMAMLQSPVNEGQGYSEVWYMARM